MSIIDISFTFLQFLHETLLSLLLDFWGFQFLQVAQWSTNRTLLNSKMYIANLFYVAKSYVAFKFVWQWTVHKWINNKNLMTFNTSHYNCVRYMKLYSWHISIYCICSQHSDKHTLLNATTNVEGAQYIVILKTKLWQSHSQLCKAEL